MRRILSNAVVVAVACTTQLARADERVPVSIGFLYPLATNANRPDVTSNADVSALYRHVGNVEGLQLGGGVVHAARDVEGVQIGGVASVAGGSMSGVQLGGVANVALERVTGVQASPVNVAGPVEGLQLGLVNVGTRVRGLQLGLVNVAEDVDGGAIGLVSISKDSVHPIVWTSNLQYTNAGVKFSSKYVFTMLGVHYGTREADFDEATSSLRSLMPSRPTAASRSYPTHPRRSDGSRGPTSASTCNGTSEDASTEGGADAGVQQPAPNDASPRADDAASPGSTGSAALPADPGLNIAGGGCACDFVSVGGPANLVAFVGARGARRAPAPANALTR